MWIVQKYLKYAIIFAALWAVLAFYSKFSCGKATDGRMQPKVQDSAILLIRKQVRTMDQLNPRDIIYYERVMPSSPDSEFIGRIIAKPGKWVEIREGKVYVDDQEYPEDYISEDVRQKEDMPKVFVPKDCLFVLNDNRKGGFPDSRMFGPLSVHCVLGTIRE
jgi:signal peptidase I